MNVNRRIAEPLIALNAPLRCHIVGIGGPGMSAIARLLVEMGHSVTGSDLYESEVVEELRQRGAVVSIGHQGTVVHGADVVTYSTAIPSNNVELVEAQLSGIETRHRSGMLASLCAATNAVGIAGTHGKTTTSSMLTVALQACGLDPSFAIGGTLTSSGSNAHRGTGDLFVAEADESDGSFIEYHPYSAIVTNVEHDHVDFFATPESVEQAFRDFAATIKPGGFLTY